MNDATDTEIFTIESGVAIPARTIPSAGPRESKYPVDKLVQGQAFAVPVTDEKQARQKQSQFSGLAKTRGIKLVTRFFAKDSPFASVPAPCLGIWHDGPAVAKAAPAASDASPAASDAAQADEGVLVL